MGGTSSGSVDANYGFHAGTDLSAWNAATGPFDSWYTTFSVTAGSRPFATYYSYGSSTPGLSVRTSDVVGTIWTPDQEWLGAGWTLADLGLNLGVYSISDAVTGETISIVVGAAPVSEVPLPAGLPLLLAGLGSLVVVRRRQR